MKPCCLLCHLRRPFWPRIIHILPPLRHGVAGLLLTIALLGDGQLSHADPCFNQITLADADYHNQWHAAAWHNHLGHSGHQQLDMDRDGSPELVLSQISDSNQHSLLILQYDANSRSLQPTCQSDTFASAIRKIAPFSNRRVRDGSLIGFENGDVYIANHTRGELIALADTDTHPIDDLAVGDLNNDGQLDIVILSGEQLTIYDAETYERRSQWPVDNARQLQLGRYQHPFQTDIALDNGQLMRLTDAALQTVWQFEATHHLQSADIDDDGLDELVVYQNDQLRLLDIDQRRLRWALPISLQLLHIADIDGDQTDELLAAERGIITVINGKTGLPNRQIFAPLDSINPNPLQQLYLLLAVDLDLDNQPELLWGGHYMAPTQIQTQLTLYNLVDSVPLWQSPANDDNIATIAYGDINGDGNPERIHASNNRNQAMQPLITATQASDNSLLWQTTLPLDNADDGDTFEIVDLLIADLGQNGRGDLFLAGNYRGRGQLLIINSNNGNLRWSFDLTDASINPLSKLLLDDLNGDGLVDLVVASGRQRSTLQIFDPVRMRLQEVLPRLDNLSAIQQLHSADLNRDGHKEILALASRAHIIDSANANRQTTEELYRSATINSNAFNMHQIYLGRDNGDIDRVYEDGSVETAWQVCDDSISALTAIPGGQLALICGQQLGLLNTYSGQIDWQTEAINDPHLGYQGRLLHHNLDGLNSLYTSGERAWHFVGGTAASTPQALPSQHSGHARSVLLGQLQAVDDSSLPLRYILLRPPEKGLLVFTNPRRGQFIYEPPGNFLGELNFEFFVSNSAFNSEPIRATIHLTNTNPIGADISLQQHWQDVLTGNLLGDDLNDDPLIYEILNQPAGGIAELLDAHTGLFRYINLSADTQNAFIDYRVSDGFAWSEVHRYDITLTNDAPTSSHFAYQIPSNRSFSTLIGAQDPNGDALTYELTSSPQMGSVSLSSSGQLIYQPQQANYIETIRYRAYDGRDESEEGQISLSVTLVEASADAPSPNQPNGPPTNDSGNQEISLGHLHPWLLLGLLLLVFYRQRKLTPASYR